MKGALPNPMQKSAMTSGPYPNTEAMKQGWAVLSAAIAAAPREFANAPSDRRGSLVVLGSGLAHVDLTADTEAEVVSADHVFYCIYDRLTQIWISRLRPDALDMTVLYNPNADRFFTYIRMAEAMLHYVRQGKKVVAIYYGHPGVFAVPTHRAIAIARREGHTARMRPGVSALDYLVADVGFDPALPGLLTYEATDMLLRRRPIDPSLHVVLWQVGVVGEFGFSPEGFKNHGFDTLLDALEAVYGLDWEIVHYIAPQYVGIAPLIERHRIGDLRATESRKHICSLSTFYIEPMEAKATDPERSITLGLTTPNQVVHEPQRSYAVIDYGPQEIEALDGFASMSVPPWYSVPQPTAASDFMFALSRDVTLQEQYRADPDSVLNAATYDHLPKRTRRLLSIPHPWAISTAICEGVDENI